MSFNVGDRVVYHIANGNRHYTGWHEDLDNATGTVIREVGRKGGSIAVEFDKSFLLGHDCNQRGKYGHCYFVHPIFFSKIPSEMLELEEML